MKIALVIFVALLWCACGTQMECDDVECMTLDRFTQIADESSLTVPLLTIPNSDNSVRCIALGSADQVGLVRIKPRISNVSTLADFYVSARAPYIGKLEGPVDVFAVLKQTATTPMLDIATFDRVPPFMPVRAALHDDQSVAVAAGALGGGTSTPVRVTGRRRIRIMIACPSDAVFTVNSAAYANSLNWIVDTIAGVTGSTRYVYEISPTMLFDGSTDPGRPTVDAVNVSFTNGGAAPSTSTVTVQAWD